MTEAYDQVSGFVNSENGPALLGSLQRFSTLPMTEPEYLDAVDAVSLAIKNKVWFETKRNNELDRSDAIYKSWASKLVETSPSLRASLVSAYAVRGYMPALREREWINWSKSKSGLSGGEWAQNLDTKNAGHTSALDRFHNAVSGLLNRGDSMEIGHLAYRADRFIASDAEKFPLSGPGKLFLSHGLRLPVTLGGPLGITPSGMVLDDAYRVATSGAQMATAPDLLSDSRLYAFGPKNRRVYALCMKTKPWLRVLYPYGERATERIKMALPSLRQEIASQWSGFGCTINGHNVPLADIDGFFDRTMSQAYYVVDTSTHTRASSKARTQEFLDSASHSVLFVPSAADDPVELHRQVARSLGSDGDYFLPGPWSPVVYSQDPFGSTKDGQTAVDIRVDGRRPTANKSELAVEVFQNNL